MANITNLDFVKLTRGTSKISRGCDYLRLSFLDKINLFDDLLSYISRDSGITRGVNDTNSHYGYMDNFFGFPVSYERFKTSVGDAIKFTMGYCGVPVPMFNFVRFSAKNKVQDMYGKLDFYGSFFRMIEIGELPDDIINMFVSAVTNENPKITRIDYRIDLFYNETPKNLKQSIKSYERLFSSVNSNSKTNTYYVGNRLQSWSIGNKSNHRYFIRMYNKIDDIKRGEKFFYYQDYLDFIVHRFEVEFGNRFTKDLKLSDYDYLIKKCESFIGIGDHTFDGLMFYEYKKENSINKYNELLFTKLFTGKSQKFFDSDINMLKLLSDYYNTKTDIFTVARWNRFVLEFIQDFKNRNPGLLSIKINEYESMESYH